jgi:hypothetical protein
MGEMYGQRFFREYGLRPTDTWVAAIQRMTDASVVASLTALSQSGRVHPPTLPEFVAAGTRAAAFGLDYVPQHLRDDAKPQERLPCPPPTDEQRAKARAHIDAMLAMLAAKGYKA